MDTETEAITAATRTTIIMKTKLTTCYYISKVDKYEPCSLGMTLKQVAGCALVMEWWNGVVTATSLSNVVFFGNGNNN